VGTEEADCYRVPDAAPERDGAAPQPDPVAPAAPAGGKPRVSLCLIVKDEETNLGDCLRSAADLFDEVIVMDTGSTDRTREIAAELGAKVFDFPWCDDFAAAHNACLDHATGDWIFWMDADDRLDEPNCRKLAALLGSLGDEHVAYAMKCLCVGRDNRPGTAVDHVRLFRRRPDVRWEFRVHEQILQAVRQSGGRILWSDVVIHHVGYQDPALRRRKLERDLRLLRIEDAEHPDHAFTLFNLGSVYLDLGRPADALPCLRRSLERSDRSDSIIRKVYALLVQCHRQLRQPAEALAACREGRSHYPEDAELLFREAGLRQDAGDDAGAEALLLQLSGTREKAHFASVDTGLWGYKGRQNLAVLYHRQGRHAEAEAQWRAALAERPGFVPAWLGLADVCLAQQRWTEVDEVSRRVAEFPGADIEAAVLRGRAHLARKEFAAARQILQEAIARAPEAMWPRVILSHVELQEGRDWPAAERALLAILELDPEHQEARHNLAVPRARLNPPAGAA
jgi:tetratricopeptide (TPR) repeat protein